MAGRPFAKGENGGKKTRRPTVAELNARRWEMLRWIAEDGLTQEDVAERLGVTVQTVKNDYKWLVAKMGVKNFNQVLYRYGRLRERKVARQVVLREIAEGRFEPLQKPDKSGRMV